MPALCHGGGLRSCEESFSTFRVFINHHYMALGHKLVMPNFQVMNCHFYSIIIWSNRICSPVPVCPSAHLKQWRDWNNTPKRRQNFWFTSKLCFEGSCLSILQPRGRWAANEPLTGFQPCPYFLQMKPWQLGFCRSL